MRLESPASETPKAADRGDLAPRPSRTVSLQEAEVSVRSVIVAVDTETLEQLRAAARSERATLADVIRQAIRAHLDPAVRKTA